MSVTTTTGSGKTVVILRRDAIRVENPPYDLAGTLRYWRREMAFNERTHRRDVRGHYEDLCQISKNALTTLPGFAHRVLAFLRERKLAFAVSDQRVPLPKPNLEAACAGLRDYQVELVLKMALSGGGILAAPTGSGKTACLAGLIRAFDPGELQLRGTPLVLVAAPDKDIVRKNREELQKFLPGREVGIIMSGSFHPSDDIISITLDSLDQVDPTQVGLLLVDEVHTAASEARANVISAFRNAARWGVSATPTGRFDGGDLLTEGLFGPVVVSRTYQDLVKAGALVPIQVIWLEAPPPEISLDAFRRKDRGEQFRLALAANPAYVGLVAEILREIPDDQRAICFTQYLEEMDAIHRLCPEIPYVHAQTQRATGSIQPLAPKDRAEIYRRMAAGEIHKIFATYVWKQGVDFPDLDIVVNASGGGSDILSKQIPGRASRKVEGKDCAYVVDFYHPWDMDPNGKPGPLLSCDYARRSSYEDLGFTQKKLGSLRELPFIKK